MANPDNLKELKKKISLLEKENEELFKSNEELDAVYNNAQDGIALLDLTGKILKVNRRIIDIGGFSEKELVGKRLAALKMFDLESIVKMIKGLGTLILGKKLEPYEVNVKNKKGKKMIYEIHAGLIKKNGKPIGAVSLLRDVTSRNLTKQALVESEKRLKDIIENATEWIWESDKNGKYTYSSPTVEKIMGYSQQEVLKKHFYDFFAPKLREKYKKTAFEVFAQKKSFRNFENKNIHKNGKTVWLLTSGIPLLDSKGNLLGYKGADLDITKLKNAEREANEKTRRVEFLNKIITIGNNAEDADSFLKNVLDTTLNFLGMDTGGIYLVDESKGTAKIKYSKGLSSQFIEKVGSVKINEENYRTVFVEGKPIFSENYAKLSPKNAKIDKLLSIASIPLVVKSKVIGALNISTKSHYSFSNEEKELLLHIAKECGTVLVKMLAEEKLRTAKENLETKVEERTNELNCLYNSLEKQNKELIKRTIDLAEAQKDMEDKNYELGIAKAGLEDQSSHLEEEVKKRTKELNEKIEEMKKFNRLAVGRELKMIELKEEIKKLEDKN